MIRVRRGGEAPTFTVNELELLLEALAYRAGRHESMARFNPQNAGPHERKAEAMRRLRERLQKREVA